jgi:hypothetical protein
MMETIRNVTYDGEEYELKFDGATDGDRDLLVTERIPHKRAAHKIPRLPVVERVPKTTPETEARDGVIRSLLRTGQMTVGQIRRECKCTDHEVRTALARLKRVGMLRWDTTPIRRGDQWRPATRYWMVSEDES